MTIERDVINIVDIEATCWQDQQAPPDQCSEIIEIGICTYHVKKRRIDAKRSLFVMPTESEISPFCTELTTITPDKVAAEGIAFDVACAILRATYDGQARLWASWGNYDRRMFSEQCARREIAYPFSDQHLNVKTLFANVYGLRYRPGMAQALDHIGLDMIGTHHRGDDDAHNIARILDHMLAEHGHDLLASYWRD